MANSNVGIVRPSTPAQIFFNLVDIHHTFLSLLVGSQPYNTDYKTLAKLGRTCKGISDSSLNVLWSKLNDLDPIFRLLPGDVRERTAASGGTWRIHLLRPLKEEDLVAFDKYAVRVITLNLTGFTNPTSLSLLSSLKALRDPLFPSMENFLWHPNVHFGTVEALTVISPSSPKRHLEITMWNPVNIQRDNQALTESIEKFHRPLSTWFPDISSLDLRCGEHLTHPDILGALKTLSDLQEFHSHYAIDSAIFDHLAALPNLHSIRLAGMTPDLFRNKPRTPIFPSLQKVNLQGNAGALYTFFSRLRSQAKEITLQQTDNQPVDKSYIHVIVYRHTSTLQHFNFTGSNGKGMGFLDILDVDEFSPLYACAQLKSFALKASARKVHFNDSTIASMAKSWPMLETLEFYSRFVQQVEWQTPEVTLYGLWPLVENCPRLSSLSMPVDACVDGPFPLIEQFRLDIPGEEKFSRHPCIWIEEMLFYLSPCENQHFVSDFMNFAFPHLLEFTAGPPRHRPEDERKWRPVKDSLPNVDLEMKAMMRALTKAEGFDLGAEWVE